MGYYTDKPLKIHGGLGAMAQDYNPSKESRDKYEASQPSVCSRTTKTHSETVSK